jgi:hypothetical protein
MNMLQIIDNLNTIDFIYNNSRSSISILQSYANFLVSLKINPETVIVIKRIFHILNLFLRTCILDTKEKSNQFNSILTSISFAPPFDEEDVIFEHLHNFCDYLSIFYPNNEDIEIAITENIQNISLTEEINRILVL